MSQVCALIIHLHAMSFVVPARYGTVYKHFKSLLHIIHISELFSKLYGLVHKNSKTIIKCNGAYFATETLCRDVYNAVTLVVNSASTTATFILQALKLQFLFPFCIFV